MGVTLTFVKILEEEVGTDVLYDNQNVSNLSLHKPRPDQRCSFLETPAQADCSHAYTRAQPVVQFYDGTSAQRPEMGSW